MVIPMRIAHLADIHLGLRLYGVERNGMNIKELDMLTAFRKAVEKVILQQPDIVIIAGDLFDTPSGPRTSIRPCISILKQLISSLDGVQVIVVGGNHDSAKTSGDTAHVLLLVREAVPQLRVSVYNPSVTVVQVGDKRVGIGMFPTHYSASAYLSPVDRPTITPPAGTDHNILVVHGMYPGLIMPDTGKEDQLWQIHPSHFRREEWDYIAWGHYHEHTKLSDNEYYSGSIEHCAFPTEHSGPRGYILATLDGGLSIEHVQVEGRKHCVHTVSSMTELEAIKPEPDSFLKIRIKTDSTSSEEYRSMYKAAISLREICPVVKVEAVRSKRPITVSVSTGGPGTVSVEERWIEFCKSMPLPDGFTLDEITRRGLEALAAVDSSLAQ